MGFSDVEALGGDVFVFRWTGRAGIPRRREGCLGGCMGWAGVSGEAWGMYGRFWREYGRFCTAMDTITQWEGLGDMSTQIWQEGVVLVEVAGEPGTSEELESAIRHVQEGGDCDVVVDLGAARILTSMSLAALLRLRDVQNSRGRRLVLCGVDSATKGILSITSLDTVFEIVRDRVDAFATVQASPDG